MKPITPELLDAAAEFARRIRPKPPHVPLIYGLTTTERGERMVYTHKGPETRWLLFAPICDPMAPGEFYPWEPGPLGKVMVQA